MTRLSDPPQSFVKNVNTKYSHKNPCDFICFSGKHRLLFPVELKSTKNKSFSVQLNKDDNPNAMIKYHQIVGLTNFAKFNYVVAGFVLNLRNERNGIQKTYFQNITDFNCMMFDIGKKSCNEYDIVRYNAIEVTGELKITHYRWNVDELLNKLSNQFGGI